MRTKDYKGRVFTTKALEGYTYYYLPEDYDYPCYRIILPSSNEVEAVAGYYYFEVLVDEDNRIRNIWRYRDDYDINVELTKLPNVCEAEMEAILIAATT